jgi:hypothetical protein
VRLVSAALLSTLLGLKQGYTVQGTAEVGCALGVRYVAQAATQAEEEEEDIKGYSRGQVRLAVRNLAQ